MRLLIFLWFEIYGVIVLDLCCFLFVMILFRGKVFFWVFFVWCGNVLYRDRGFWEVM